MSAPVRIAVGDGWLVLEEGDITRVEVDAVLFGANAHDAFVQAAVDAMDR